MRRRTPSLADPLPLPLLLRLRFNHRLRLALAPVLVLGLLTVGAVPPAAGQEQGVVDEGGGRAGEEAAGFTMDHVLGTRIVRVAALSDDGQWALVTVESLTDRLGSDQHRYGDPTYVPPRRVEARVVDTRRSESRPLGDGRLQLDAAEWSPDGRLLAVRVRAGDRFEYRIWDRERERFRRVRLPGGLVPAVNGRLDPVWTPDGATLVLPARAADWESRAGAAFRALVDGPVVVLSSEAPFLEWESVRRLGSLHVLVAHDMATGRSQAVLPETMLLDLDVTVDGRLRYTVDVTEKTDYDRIFGTDGKVLVRGVYAGEPVVVLENTGKVGRMVWADDGSSYAYAKEGRIHLGHVDEEEDRVILGEQPDGDDPGDADPEADAAEPLRFSPVSFSPDASRMVVTADDDYWFLDVARGDTLRFLDTDPDAENAPEHDLLGWQGEDAVLVKRESRTEWLREIVRHGIDGDSAGLYRTADLLQGARLSRDGSTVILEAGPANRPTSVYAADSSLRDVRRLVDPNPSLDPGSLARAELVSYMDADGGELHGVLYYPLDYREGESYPTIFYVYEEFFDPRFDPFVNVMTSHGYAVMRPSVSLERGYPGEAWLKGVTAAANELIRRGIADRKRLAVQGTSYGGYAVNLLVTQTDRFAAAVNVSGKVNMVSFYTDSPRLATRNTHAPEKSQDRIGATLWEQPQKYIAHSAIMFADRIDTPMLLIGGDQDHNVPNRQLMEMYYAMRRLGKQVTWVSYTHGGHGMPTNDAAMVVDYYRRILDFYGEHLSEEREDR